MLITDNLPSIANAQLPRSYEVAKQSLAECQRLDECKDWADKSAALASYAKQANDRELMNYALRIKAHAIRRTGVLLKQIAPQHGGDRRSTEYQEDASGPLITRTAAARDAGMSERQQKTALRVANVPEQEFEAQVESDTPPTLSKLAEQGIKPRPKFPDPESWLQGRDPKAFNRVLHFVGMAERYAEDLAEWKLDEVMPHLLDEDRDELREYIGKIDAIHNKIGTRI